MKNSILFLLLFPLMLSSGYSQVNSYLQNNLVWKIHSSCAVPYPCIRTDDYNYYVNGDTTINTNVYKQIFWKGEASFMYMSGGPNNCSGTLTYIDTVPSFFLRSSGKQVYVKIPNQQTEQLLFDFDLAVGDTLPHTYNNFSTITVASIDSIQVSSGYLKVFTLTGDTWSDYLIEGIGHSRGLIEPMNVALECGWSLECFGHGDSAVYPVQGPSCELPLDLKKNHKNSTLKVYPNPAGDLIHVEAVESFYLKILSISGVELMKLETSESISTIDISSLAEGIYIIELFSDNNSSFTKLVVNR